jgi:hypothetical protein
MTRRPEPTRRRTISARARARAALALAIALSLLLSACGSSSSKTSSATKTATTATVPVQVATGPKGPPPKTRAAKFSAATQQALHRFAACMREKGVHMPEPNISGAGPVFDPKQMDTRSPHFGPAFKVCRAQLVAAVRASGSTTKSG